MARGAPIVRAFEQGLAELSCAQDVRRQARCRYLVRARLLPAVDSRHSRKTSGSGWQAASASSASRARWKARFVTGSTVWGASSAYRRGCLDEIMPLERRMGWDGVDEFRANAAGWRTRNHSRPLLLPPSEGGRAGRVGRARARSAGEAAWYLGYRPWYLLLRALHYLPREPAALAMIGGYARAALERRPQCADEVVRDYLRSQQAPRKLPARIAEALGRR